MAERRLATLSSRLVKPNHEDNEDDEALFAEIEAEIENGDDEATRDMGLEVKQELERIKEMKENHHGHYVEIKDEKEVVQIIAREARCVVHFFHTKFRRCEIMDKHLAKLAPKYFSTRCIRVFVENVPWLVERLSIKVLPCVMCFVDGISRDQIVGFEELGNSDDFDTATLETRLLKAGVIKKSSGLQMTATRGTMDVRNLRSGTERDGDDVFDLDD